MIISLILQGWDIPVIHRQVRLKGAKREPLVFSATSTGKLPKIRDEEISTEEIWCYHTDADNTFTPNTNNGTLVSISMGQNFLSPKPQEIEGHVPVPRILREMFSVSRFNDREF